MTDITPLIPEGKKVIESYGGGGFKVTGEKYSENIIIFPDKVCSFPPATVEKADEQSVHEIIRKADEIEILLVGAGKTTDFLPDNVEKLLKSKNINVEYMDTGAAARTYNVLLTEERKVAVILIAV